MNELLLTVIKMIGAASIMLAIVNMSMIFIIYTYVMLRIIKKYTKGSTKAIAKEMSEADKIEERGIAQFEDDRQSNFDRE